MQSEGREGESRQAEEERKATGDKAAMIHTLISFRHWTSPDIDFRKDGVRTLRHRRALLERASMATAHATRPLPLRLPTTMSTTQSTDLESNAHESAAKDKVPISADSRPSATPTRRPGRLHDVKTKSLTQFADFQHLAHTMAGAITGRL